MSKRKEFRGECVSLSFPMVVEDASIWHRGGRVLVGR